MLQFFQSIYGLIVAVLTFVIHGITAFFKLITQIPTYLSFLISAVGYLPAFLIPFATFGIFLSVMRIIVNRKVGDQ